MSVPVRSTVVTFWQSTLVVLGRPICMLPFGSFLPKLYDWLPHGISNGVPVSPTLLPFDKITPGSGELTKK